jgi:hypothetical protein
MEETQNIRSGEWVVGMLWVAIEKRLRRLEETDYAPGSTPAALPNAGLRLFVTDY